MSVDPLSDVLSLLTPHTYVAGGFDLRGRWSIAFDPHTGIKCYALLSGACWLAVDGLAEPVRLEAGDCVVLPNGRRFRLASDPALEPTPLAQLHAAEWRGGIATLSGGGETSILGGHFAFSGAHADVLLGAMPPVAHLREDRDKLNLRWALERMRQELVEARPGGVLVAQHLAHMVLVQALRLYLAGGAGRHAGWLFALADPQLAAAIGAMHAAPGARWTLPALAAKATMSRSSFARAFKATVGTSPLDYLTRWRMLLAGARLRDRREPVASIARSLGYDSESAFGTAFKRVMGCSPRQYVRARPPAGAPHPWATTAVARAAGTEG
ncbi:MAG: Transcriptional regulator, AraC family [uncultured Gemmatimonadaceae bacterium]|uniref:Transcriptional regulator, AraC family n=1 Tax=uncultured Gemmatimonadaceae bacterium TaxID=246130 RepID=A0A6J4JZR1_9BACT|nr:MAG: Transcriptional regulator, AraC family [uncultured Gemmatimonadaceae bacterium]